jgi:DNA mismatch repair ATPase MutS
MASTEFYQQRAAQFQSQVVQLEKTIRQFSIGRIVVALVIIALAYFGFKEALFFYPLPLLVILFFFLVKSQLRKEEAREVLLHLVNLNTWEASACQYDFKNFSDGQSFIDPHHSYSHDLDLFGSGSLFQYINRCATHLGEKDLANHFLDLKLDKKSILLRQEAIRELGTMLDFRQQCWATGKQINDANFDLNPLWLWLKEPALFLGKNFFSAIRWVLPVLTCLSLAGILFDPIFKSIFLFLFLTQLGITSAYNKPITKLQNGLSIYKNILENYSRIFQLMKGQSVQSPTMKHHAHIAKEAADHVKSFSKLVNALESRMNLIARVFGNGLFLYDFHTVINLEQWRNQHASSLPHWLESLAEWDALLSFATLHYNQPAYAFAEINEGLTITGKEIGHPLINSSERVANNFDLGNPSGVMLVTGANMAGKSTFLRTIGVNYILALNGSPVCATQWGCSLATLRTGMRTSDSLQEHQSYFYAELNRLQSIIEDLRAGKPMLILLDEILKGTNSTDKQTGSRELIKQLIQQKALVLLATHDIALGDMEQQYPNQIINTCFEGKIENEQLTFDYKLNQGLAQKANATFLMRKMGIIPSSN